MRLALILILASSALGQTFDGPAELPRTVPATVAVSPNNPIVVLAGGNLQAVVNSAVCGDTIQYDPAGIWTTSSFMQPSIPTCDAQHWITIDLKGGKIILAGSNGSIKGGIFVRLANGQITRVSGTGVLYNMIAPGAGAHDIIYDSLDVEGTQTDETVRAFELSNVPNVAIINTKVREMHCLANTGTCTDSQAVNFGLDTQVQGGNYLLDHDDFEAAGENILGGGDAANFVPCDIRVTNTRLAKPYSWNPSDPTFSGRQWIVKNLFELKNGCRVLVENNTMTGSWGGFTQVGFGVLFTPKNPGGCSVCAVTNITFRKNHVSHTGSAMQLAFGKSDTGYYAADAGYWSIHDNFFDLQQYAGCFGCVSYENQLSTVVSPTGVVLHDVSVTNNEFMPDGRWSWQYQVSLIVGAPTGIPMQRIHWDSNLFPQGNLTMLGVGGGAANCGYQLSKPIDFLARCFDANSTMTGNGILVRGWTPASWPAGNLLLGSGANIN